MLGANRFLRSPDGQGLLGKSTSLGQDLKDARVEFMSDAIENLERVMMLDTTTMELSAMQIIMMTSLM